jgi:hypothetical protein
MLRHALVLTAALALVPAGAQAASYTLRPDADSFPGWVATPSGTAPWDALNDPVVAFTPPSTSSDYLSSMASTQSFTEVNLQTASLLAGETVTGATAWVYLQTGTIRDAQVYVDTGPTVLGSTVVPPGSPAGWYPVPLTAPATQSQINAMQMGFIHTGTTGTPTVLYAAYVQLDTNGGEPPPSDPPPSDPPPSDPPPSDPPPSDPPPSDPPPSDPPVLDPPVVDPPGVDPLPTDPVVDPTPEEDVPGIDPGDVVEPALAITGQSPTATSAGVVPITVECPDTSVEGCTGTMWLEESLDAGSTSSRIQAARRSPKRFSKPKKYKLKQGQKKTVPVRLDRRNFRKFKKKRSFKVTVVAQQKDSTGQVMTMRRTVRVFNTKKKKR